MQMHDRHTLLFDDTETNNVYAQFSEYPACLHQSLLLEEQPSLYGDIAPALEPGMVQVMCCDVYGNTTWVTISEDLAPLARAVFRTIAHVDATLHAHIRPPSSLPKQRAYVPRIPKPRAKTVYNAFIASVLRGYNGSNVPRRERIKSACEQYRAFRAKQKEDAIVKCREGEEHLTCSVDTEASPSTFDPGDGT